MAEDTQRRARGLMRLLIFARKEAVEMGSDEAAASLSKAITSLKLELEIDALHDLFVYPDTE